MIIYYWLEEIELIVGVMFVCVCMYGGVVFCLCVFGVVSVYVLEDGVWLGVYFWEELGVFWVVFVGELDSGVCVWVEVWFFWLVGLDWML